MWTASLFLYSFTYLLYFFLLISVEKNSNSENHFYIYLKKAIPAFLILLGLAIIFLIKILHLPFETSNIWFYIHGFLMALLGGIVANMWGIPQLRKIRVLFALGVTFLILTNLIYGIDEIIYHRRHHIIDVFVACSNGLSQVFIILGVIKFIKFNRG